MARSTSPTNLVLDDDGDDSKSECPSQWVGGVCGDSGKSGTVSLETVSAMAVESTD